MQFLTIVVVPAETYDVERSVAARKEYVPHEELDYLVEVNGPFGLNRDDVDAVVAELQEDTGFVCGHDEGRIWYMTTNNPQGEWDGWRLHSLQDDSWPATEALPEQLYPLPSLRPMGSGMT
jgi:hypothetical protein